MPLRTRIGAALLRCSAHGVLVVILGCSAARAGLSATCSGDCNGDGRVSVSELIHGLRIALGLQALDGCPAFDTDGDGRVGIGELNAAVNALLSACPPPATPTPEVSPEATATPTALPTDTPQRTPPLSSRICGDGVLQPGEECDDANRTAGDGCNALCRSEDHPDPCVGVTPRPGTRLNAVLVAKATQPLYATAPPGDVERLFIVEQAGRIRILRAGQVLPTPFLDLTSRVASGGERGLLGLAFHPFYARNGEFFVDYTMLRGDTLVSVVSRFHVSADPDRADADSEEILLEQIQPYNAHNGGQLAFDAAGYLYISFGDGGRSATTQNNAQDPTTWLGKILRVDVDGGIPYAIPPDNPLVGSEGARAEIWAMGLRNPWRCSIDPATNDLYIGDVGEGRHEEIDVAPADRGGLNFGWCCSEASEPFANCFRRATTCPAGGLTDPIAQYDHDEGCSVTGGFVYRGCALPDLHGTYFYGDYCTAFVRSLVYRDGMATDERDWTSALAPLGGERINSLAGFGRDGRGELYLCDLRGQVFKLVPSDEPPATPAGP